jgi:hypothetical protein
MQSVRRYDDMMFADAEEPSIAPRSFDSSSLGTAMTNNYPPSLFSAGNNDRTMDPSTPQQRQRPRLSVTDRFAMLMSNYDPSSVRFDTTLHGGSAGDDDDDDDDAASEWRRLTAAIHQIRPGIHHQNAEHHLPGMNHRVSLVPERVEEEEDEADEEEADEEYHPRKEGSSNIIRGTQSSWQRQSSSTMEPDEESVIADGSDSRSWSVDLFMDAYDEIRHNCRTHMKESFQVDERSLAERIIAFLELPFIALRTVSFLLVCACVFFFHARIIRLSRRRCCVSSRVRIIASFLQDVYPHPLRGQLLSTCRGECESCIPRYLIDQKWSTLAMIYTSSFASNRNFDLVLYYLPPPTRPYP